MKLRTLAFAVRAAAATAAQAVDLLEVSARFCGGRSAPVPRRSFRCLRMADRCGLAPVSSGLYQGLSARGFGPIGLGRRAG